MLVVINLEATKIILPPLPSVGIRKKDIQKDIVLPLIHEFDKSQEMNLAKTILEEVRSTDYGFYSC